MNLLGLLAPNAADVLARLPLEDRSRTERLLHRLGERAGTPPEAVPLLEAVIGILPAVPDADLAILNLERWSAQLPTPRSMFPLLVEHPRLLADLLTLFGSSRYLADVLVRDPLLYNLLLEPSGPYDAAVYAREVDSALGALRHADTRRDALRRVKRRGFLRIGWRDLARRAPLEEVVREISDLADAVVRGALQLAREEVDARFPTASAAVRFSVIAMGKLGARELNYSSDIDLLFVMDSDTPLDESHRRYAQRLAETLISVLAQETGEGRCFRVDMRLRPEGRFGALVRSYGAFRTYYDRWAETWERQALIKARPVAGDPELGERFLRLVEPVVYRRVQGAALLEDVREMRTAVEQRLSAADEMETHVKEGRGTIRDVEFTLQLLQLLFGGDHPEIRAPDTLTALERLTAAGLLIPDERAVFERGYRFFREVEHRLQLMDDLPVRLLPTEPIALRRLARSIGFDDAAAFNAAYGEISASVRALVELIHARLGATGERDPDGLRTALLAADTPTGAADLHRRLAASGYPDPNTAARALVRLAAGLPGYPHPSSTRRLFADLAPPLFAACATAADPTWALEGVADVADRKLLHRAFYQGLLAHPESAVALARFSGAAPTALRIVLRHPELSDLVMDEEQRLRRKDAALLGAELEERLAHATTHLEALSVLRRFKLRELVRLAARHALAPVLPEVETAEWSDLADVLLHASLRLALDQLRAASRWPRADEAGFAIIALGRHGGRDLHFVSDLDLLYLFGGEDALPQQQYELLARELSSVVQSVTEEGRLFDLDLRLRPEGRQGFAVSRLEAVSRYYGEGGRGETWELQMLTRARAVAGCGETARRFLQLVQPRVYRDPMPEGWRGEIAGMKRRIEQERANDVERERHLKLGPGGLSDLEFLVQFLQLRHGAVLPAARVTSTLDAISALAGAEVLSVAEADVLVQANRLLTSLRQSLTLLLPDGPTDLLPDPVTEPRVACALARAVGYDSPEALSARYREATGPVRSLMLGTLEGPTR